MSSALEKVVAMVQVLNHDTLPCNRLAANKWLMQFKHSHDAWEVATSLLTASSLPLPPGYDFEVHFFAAQILRRKIKSEGCYLNPRVKADLLNALLLAVQRFSRGPSQLLTQICLALSSLMLRMEDQKATIQHLFHNLAELQAQEHGYVAVLELLTVLPEEVTEELIGGSSTDSQTRNCFKRELLSYAPNVLTFLIAQSEQRLDDVLLFHERNRKIIRCLLSWVRVECFSEMQPASLAQHPLVNFVFNSLQISHFFDVAIEVMTELVSRYEGLPEIFICRVPYINEVLLLPALKSGEEKIIIGIASLLSEIGQAAPSLIAEGSNEALLLVDALLSCVTFPSEDCEIADSTLPFWCSLAHYILGAEIQNGKRRVIFEVFSSLLNALLSRAQVDDSVNERQDMSNSLINFRLNLEELLVNICQLMGTASFVTKLIPGDWVSSTQSIPWKEVEVRMFALYMAQEAVMQAGQLFDVSVIMNLVTTLSKTIPEERHGILALVYNTVGEVLSSYSKWFMCNCGPNLRQLLAFCASGIGQPTCSKACSSALHKFCEEGSSVIHEPQNLEILFWIIENLEKKNMTIEEEEEVVGAITLALNCIPNKDLKKTYLAKLVSWSCTSIQKLIDADLDQSLRENPAAHTLALNLAVRGLSRLGALFGHLTSPMLEEVEYEDDTNGTLVGILWPLLEKLLASSHMENDSLSAATCRSLSLAIHTSAQCFLALLPLVLDSLSTNFLKYQNHDCYLRTAAVAIKEIGHIEEYSSLYMTTFERFNSSASISGLTSSDICDKKPDLIEAYTGFASSFVSSCCKEVIIASGQLLEYSFQKAAISCTAMHTGAALAAMSYMSCLLEVGLSSVLETKAGGAGEGSLSGVIVNLLSRCGEGLISSLLYALLGVSAMPRVHKSAIILQQLAALCSICERTVWRPLLSWEYLSTWLQSSVQALPPEYLKPGEAEVMVPSWLEALQNAALDFLKTASTAGDSYHMRGKGGRTLKRIIRDFAESHRHTPATNL